MKEIPAWLEQEHGEAMGERVQLRPCSPATVVKSSGENTMLCSMLLRIHLLRSR